MSELTTPTTSTTSTTSAVDEGARFRGFTALGLALTALLGGGVFSAGLQWLANYRFVDSPDDPTYALALGGAPVAMSLVALWLASSPASSTDSLARPVGRASQALSVLAILGGVLLMVAVLSQP